MRFRVPKQNVTDGQMDGGHFNISLPSRAFGATGDNYVITYVIVDKVWPYLCAIR